MFKKWPEHRRDEGLWLTNKENKFRYWCGGGGGVTHYDEELGGGRGEGVGQQGCGGRGGGAKGSTEGSTPELTRSNKEYMGLRMLLTRPLRVLESK